MADATNWIDSVERTRPLHLSIVRALDRAIRSGLLEPGDRLPPQRAVADRLKVDLTTVTRAYAQARREGMIEGAVGRGTYVLSRTPDEAGPIDLSMNQPPPPKGESLSRRLQETISDILQSADIATLMAYHAGAGSPGQRAAGASWLAPMMGPVDQELIVIAAGAQAALAAVQSVVARPGDTVIVEALTYPGVKAAAATLGLRLVPCPVDRDGLVLADLERLCTVERPAAIYLVPTMQNPAAATTPVAHRQEIARIARDCGAWIVEDDPYTRLTETPPPAVASFAPERTFHIATLSKCLTPGLRTAYVACPSSDAASQVREALRATTLMPPPLMTAVATRWIRDGAAQALMKGVRREAGERRAMAQELLPQALGPADGIHVWLPLPAERSMAGFRQAAQDRGLSVVTADAFAVGDTYERGVRISLGSAPTGPVLARGLRELAALLAAGSDRKGKLLV